MNNDLKEYFRLGDDFKSKIDLAIEINKRRRRMLEIITAQIMGLDMKTTESNKDSDSEIVACVDPGKWIIKISNKGIKFNREEYPEALPDDFAKAFVEILERQFDVTIKKNLNRK